MSETYIEIEKDTGHSIETDEKEIETDGRDIETDGKDIETDEKDTRHNIDNEYNFGDVNERHRGRPITLTIASPDGKYLVTYSYDDDSIVGWNVDNNKDEICILNPIYSLAINHKVKIISVSNNNKLVFTSLYGSKLKIIDMENDKNEIHLNLIKVTIYHHIFNLNNEFILYDAFCKIILIYSTETKNNEWMCKRIYRLPEKHVFINMSMYNRLYLFSCSDKYIYEWNIGAEKSTRIFATNFEFFRVKYIGLVFEKYSKIIDNENYICLDNEDKLIIYSIELKIPIASLDKNNVQSQNITNHTELYFLYPLLSSEIQKSIIKKCFGIEFSDELPQLLFTTKHVFGIRNGCVWMVKFKKNISKPNLLLKNSDELDNGNNDDNIKSWNLYLNFDEIKINKEVIIDNESDIKIYYVEKIHKLFEGVIDENERKIKKIDENLIKIINDNIVRYTNKWDIIIIQIIEIKKPNWEAFILTDNGIFIYSFSFKNDEKTISASLRYSFYMDLRWEGLKGSQYYKGSEYYEGLQYHRELFSKSLPSQIYPIYFNDIYVVISALLFKAMSIDENERKIKKIDKHLIKIINDNIVIDTNKRNIIIIEIIEIKIPNWEAFILTDNGIFIYCLNSNSNEKQTSASIKYFYFMDLGWKGLEGSKRLQHYKELFSREWPLSNYDSFKMYNADIEGWNLYLGSSDSDELDNENNSFNDSDKLDNGSNDIDSDKSDNENNNDVDIIRTLFKAALIDGNERKIKKIDINLISLLSGNIIKKTNKRNIVIIEIIEIKTLHNWEAFILTDYGIFIYLLNSNSNEKLTSASLRYFYFTDLRLKPTNVQYYEDSILKSLKVDNENNDRINDSFKKIKGVNSDELDNENNDRINEDNFKMNNQTIDSDVKIIQKLFDAVSIEEDKREKNKIDIHLISLLYANIIKDIGFTNIIIIEIIEIKTPTNWEAFVLTINGIFIYSFFKNDEKTMSASLRYSYYMNNVLHYKELFSTSLPSATEINNEITDDVKIIQQLFKAVSIEEAKKEKNEINFHFELRLRNNISKDIKAWSHYIIDIIEIIEIKREFFILTNYGIFIYYLNLKEKLSLRYFYYIEKIKENEVNHFEELFSKSLPSPNYESFEKNNEYLSCIEKVFSNPLTNYDSFTSNSEWTSYKKGIKDNKDNREYLLKCGVELLSFAIKNHKLELIENIYKKCIFHFKEDLRNNKMFLSIITSSIQLLNEHYPEYILRYSLETTMIIDSPTYCIYRQDYDLHLHTTQYPQMINLTPSILWSKFYNFPILYYLLLGHRSFNSIYYSIGNLFELYIYISLPSAPTITFMNPYIKFVNYPEDYSPVFELIKPKSSPFVKTINRNIYETWNGEVLINFKWNTYGKYYYAIIWIIFMALLGCFTAAAAIPQQDIDENTLKILLIASFMLGIIHLIFEIRQFIYDPVKYVHDVWNIFDVIAYLLPTITSIYWFKTDVRNAKLLAFSCLFLDLKWLLFLRAFESFGVYFAIIISVAKDIVYFLVVIFIVLISFAHAFYILLSPESAVSFKEYTNNNNPNNPWNIANTYNQIFENGTMNLFMIQQPNENTNMFINYGTALFAIYKFLTGDSSALSNWPYLNNQSLVILIVLFSLLIVVYLMNLFIGLLNSAIDKHNNRVSYLIQKAEILAEIELFYLLPYQRRKKTWFPDVIYYYAHVDKTREEIRKLNYKKQWNTDEFSEMKKELLNTLNIKLDNNLNE